MFVVLVRFQKDIIKVVILVFDERAALVIESSKTRVNMTIQKHKCRGDGCGSHLTCALAAGFRLALPLPAQAQPAQAQQARHNDYRPAASTASLSTTTTGTPAVRGPSPFTDWVSVRSSNSFGKGYSHTAGKMTVFCITVGSCHSVPIGYN